MTKRKLGVEINAETKGKRDVKKLADSVEDFRHELDKTVRSFEENRREADDLRQAYKKLGYSGEGTKDELDELEAQLKRTTQEQKEHIEATRKLIKTYDRADDEADGFGDEIRDIGQQLDHAENNLSNFDNELEEMGRNFKLVDKKAKEANRELKDFDNIASKNETAAEGFRRELDQSIKSFEDSRRASISMRSEWKRLAKSGEASQDELKALSTEIDKVQQSQLENIGSTRDLMRQYKKANGEVNEFSDEFRVLGRQLQDAEGYINGVTNKVKTMGQGFHKVDNRIKGTNRALKGTNRELKDLNRTANRSEAVLGDLSRKVGPGMVAMGNLIAEGMEEAAQAVFEFTKDSSQAYYDFDRKSREIFTLIPKASGKMKQQLQADALALGTELGRLPEETLPAIYNALSAGIPADNVIDDVRTASEAARAGVADLDSTLKLGMGVLNAQVTGVSNLEEVYDLLFFTVKNGVITLPEMNEVMSQVTSIAGEANVSMQDISSAMIVMTRQGDSASEAAELLSIMLTQLSTSGTTLASVFEDAAGKSFRTFTEEGGSLAEAMGILQQHADDTGQALGDILGGGSPFFRDTQAARGALELTGKHLEEMIKFSNEAEGAMGSMGEAAATMGESAELGVLQAKSAVAEFKIAFGELIDPMVTAGAKWAKEASEMGTDVINLSKQIEEQGDNVVATALATGDYAEAGSKLASALRDVDNTLGKTSGGYDIVLADVLELTARTADLTGGGKELERSLKAVYGEAVELNGDLVILDGTLVATVEDLKDLNKQYQLEADLVTASSEAIAQYDQKLIQNSNTRAEALRLAAEEREQHLLLNDALHGTADAYYQQTDAILSESEAAALSLEQKEALILAQEEETAAILAKEEALQAARAAYGYHVLGAAWATDAEINWKDELFESATALGINQYQVETLAIATGEYSDEQIEAMLRTAAMRIAVEELSEQMANGDLTTRDALAAMQDFEAQLDRDYKAQFDYSDLDDATGAAYGVRDALLAAEGDYSASFTTTNTTINVIEERHTKDNGSSKEGADAYYSGGDFRADEFLIVGDGPNGQILPTTELVAFDRPGTVISGRDTNDIFNRLSEQSNNGETTTTAPANIEVHLHLHGETTSEKLDEGKDMILEAMREAGFTV